MAMLNNQRVGTKIFVIEPFTKICSFSPLLEPPLCGIVRIQHDQQFSEKKRLATNKTLLILILEHHWSLCSKFASFGFVNCNKLIGSIPCTPETRGIFSSFALPKTPWGSQMEKTKDTSHHNHQLWSTMNGQYISYVIECLLLVQLYLYLHRFVFSVLNIPCLTACLDPTHGWYHGPKWPTRKTYPINQDQSVNIYKTMKLNIKKFKKHH